MRLVLEFEGWILLRLATDPDPTDEPRGVSGYTFAFGDEPDLDRVLRLQPPDGWKPRSGSPQLGVTVRRTMRDDGTRVAGLEGLTVDLLDEPRLENRNWTLTPPGFEPIVPFRVKIGAGDLSLLRDAPLNPAEPHQPVWEMPEALLAAQAANGMNFEPDTIGRATGIWDSLAVCKARLAQLERELADEKDEAAAAALSGRIKELEIAVGNPNDRRVRARYYAERFGFPVAGRAAVGVAVAPAAGGELDVAEPWPVSFWLGAWDPDLLCAYLQGSLEIPYA